jgi:ThiF family protein
MTTERSRTFLTPEQMQRTARIAVFGCGSVGGGVAVTLSRMGFGDFLLVDHGDVEAVNVGPQMFGADQEGLGKARATEQWVRQFSPLLGSEHFRALDPETNEMMPTFPWGVGPEVTALDSWNLGREGGRSWHRAMRSCGVLVLAVDTMATRKAIMEMAFGGAPEARRWEPRLVIDVRMGLQELWLETLIGAEREAAWRAWPDDAQTVDEPCTARTIAYTPGLAAAWVGRIVAAFCREDPFPRELHIDMKVFSGWSVWREGERVRT